MSCQELSSFFSLPADGMLNTSPSQFASQEIPAMLHLILKTYNTTTIVNLSTHQQSPKLLVP
ncbi:hypothetical protein P692DRAFT_20894852 [Suillus brevipes Sb2]|nr:hypothetical protein P692DRAFT_20894852 [Suillus brevipes Sb2]